MCIMCIAFANALYVVLYHCMYCLCIYVFRYTKTCLFCKVTLTSCILMRKHVYRLQET